MTLQALALQKLDHPYVCGYKEFFVMWDKEVPHNSGCPAICLSACLWQSHSASVSLWFCLPVCLSHSLPLSLSLSLILPISLSASLSFSFTLSVWFCVHVCLSVSPSLPVSLSLYQILSTTSIIFSYSLILTCFFLIPVLVPWFCVIQKVFIIIIIKWKFTQEVL